MNIELPPLLADRRFRGVAQRGELAVGEAEPLDPLELGAPDRGETGEPLLGFYQLPELIQKPGIDPRRLGDFLDAEPGDERALDLEDPFRRGRAQRDAQILGRRTREPIVSRRRAQDPAGAADFERAQPFLERLLERAADRHGFAHRLHLRREPEVGRGKLLEREARHLHHDVVEHRLERRGRGARDVVGQFVQRVPDGELRPDARDGESGGFGRERRGPRDAGVHLDHEHLAVRRIHGELNVAATRFHADLADDRDRGVAHTLVFAVGERHRRRHGDRVAGVHTHGIEVLDRADDHDVVPAVAHHFELEFLPAEHAALDQR